MHVKASVISVIASFTAVSQAFIVPADMPDGRYSISLVANKNASVPLPAKAGAEIFVAAVGLPNPSIGCPGHSVYQGDENVARTTLNNWCNAGNVVRPGSAEIFSYGSAIAYVCNYGQNNPCSSGEFDTATQLMDADCGTSSAAWVLINDWAKGYGRDNKGVTICAAGFPT